MDVNRYLTNLPEKFLIEGKFCVTLKNQKAPYDPFLNKYISANDTFYDFVDIIELNTDEYDTIGYQVGSTNISAIDIDGCVEDGIISQLAMNIITDIKSYTEFSPSGKGIRILFISSNRFDRTKYKIKNSNLGIEYYDAVDQSTIGGRMVRISGNRFTKYELSVVDTTKFLDEYMIRTNKYEGSKAESGSINNDKVKFLSYMIRRLPEFYDFNSRTIMIKSESEWDLIVANMIRGYTDNIDELRAVFERTKYFKGKDKRHLDKWNGPYGVGILEKARVFDFRPNVKKYSDMFDRVEVETAFELDLHLAATILIKLELAKAFDFRTFKIVEKDWSEQEQINHLYWIINNKIKKDMLVALLNGK